MSILFRIFVSSKETSSTPKPQDPEGHTIMIQERIEVLVNTAKAIERAARLSAMDEIDNTLATKQRLYRKVLYSDEAINTYLDSHGKRHERLNELRNILVAKRSLLEDISNKIWALKHNVIRNK